MFQFETEQKVCEVGGVKFGGRPGEYPCVCVNSIFQKGDRVFKGKRKEGFNEKHAEELLKAQKLESLGVLAGGIAHDFINFLSGIMGNISLAKLEADQGQDISEALDEALRVTSRASALTRQLLVFSKGGAPV